MQVPEDFSRDELINLIRDIRDVLYMDLNEQNVEYLNPNKEWDLDALDSIAHILKSSNLIPAEPCELK